MKETARECGQEVTALCGELGGHGFEIAADNEKKIEYLKQTIKLAGSPKKRTANVTARCWRPAARSAHTRPKKGL